MSSSTSKILTKLSIMQFCYNICRSISTSYKLQMKLVQYSYEGCQNFGILKNDKIINLSSHEGFPNSIVKFLQGGSTLLEKANIINRSTKNTCLDIKDVKLLSPITDCEKIICVGLNYKDHCTEQNLEFPKEPVIFSKFPSSIIATKDNIILPKISDSVDWEVELAVVIGKEGKQINKVNAMDYVAGYTVANDVSARDWQMKKNAKQWLLGKTFDTFCPLGPALITKDAVLDPHNLDLNCVVNGNVVQSSNTKELIFDIPQCIEWISKFCTLKPGDVLLTGTPPGVGVFRNPPVFLKNGDVVSCEIVGIGKIENKVVSDQS